MDTLVALQGIACDAGGKRAENEKIDGARQGVATAFPDATDAASRVLAAGGNAADAAAAAGWALAVCEPSGSGIGGHATALIRTADGRMAVLEGKARAPSAATMCSVSRAEQHKGRKAAVVPSMPAVLAELSTRFGRLDSASAITPAIALAEYGFEWTRLQRREARWCWKHLSDTGAQAILAGRRGRPLKAGDRLRQPLLARTLARMARHGVADFYRGGIAREILRDMAENDGLMTAEDLKAASNPALREPVSIGYRGHTLFTTPPPAGGVTLLQGLKLVDRLQDRYGAGSRAAELSALLDAVYSAFVFRERWPLEPFEFTPSVRDWMLGDDVVAEMAERLKPDERREPVERGPEPPGDTTHLCVADADGNIVALTQSIQSLYGAKVAHPTLGFFYNNYLTTCLRQARPNGLAPTCVPRSNICPTLAVDARNRPRLALGAAGSRRIVSAVLQVMRRVLDQGSSVQAAVDAPRGHALLNGKVWVERPALDAELLELLERRYDRVVCRSPQDYKMGCVQALAWDDDGVVSAAADPRRDGFAWTGRTAPQRGIA